MDRFKATLTALLPLRRSLPLSAIIVTIAVVQVVYMRDWRTALVPLGMGLAFLVLAPWSWRALPWWAYVLVPLPVVALVAVALPHALDMGPTYFTDPGSLVVAVVVWLVGGWGLGRDIDLELDLEHAQLKSIKTHLDPHFLFNTLNAIAEWCVEDPKVAEDATLRLAAMLRDILDGLERRTWPLERELAVVRDLLELHRIRDPDAFTVSIPDAPPGGSEVPPLVLVSLVENAVKHGPRKGHRGVIHVRVAVTPTLRLEVENPGVFEPESPGRGLAMVRQRLALSYGARGQLAISGQGDRTLAVITHVRVLVVDDELQARKRVTRLLESLPDVEVIGACESATDALAVVARDRPDVLVLDISMPGLSGLDARARLPADGPAVIFVTAHAEHAVTAFEVGAIDYVLKPVTAARLAKAIARVRDSRGVTPPPPRLPIETRTGTVLIDTAAITYAQFDGALVTLASATEQWVTAMSLADLEARLGPTFVRVDRRNLVNLAAIARLEATPTGGAIAITHTGARIPVSRQARRTLGKRLGL